EHDVGRMDERSARQQRRVPGPWMHRRRGTRADLSADARDHGEEGRPQIADVGSQLSRSQPGGRCPRPSNSTVACNITKSSTRYDRAVAASRGKIAASFETTCSSTHASPGT